MLVLAALSCATLVSATLPSIFPMFVDTRTQSTAARKIFPPLPRVQLKHSEQDFSTLSDLGDAEFDFIFRAISNLPEAELRELYETALIPDQIPLGFLEGSTIKVLGLRPVAELVNQRYQGDEIFERECYNATTGTIDTFTLGYIIVNGQRAALGSWSIVTEVDDPFEAYRLGLVADYTRQIPSTCDPNCPLVTNPYPFRAIVDVWRRLDTIQTEEIYIARSYIRWGAFARPWAYILARHVTPEWVEPIETIATRDDPLPNTRNWMVV